MVWLVVGGVVTGLMGGTAEIVGLAGPAMFMTVLAYVTLSLLVHLRWRSATPFRVLAGLAYVDVSPTARRGAVWIRDNWPQIAVDARLASSGDVVRRRGPHLRAVHETAGGLSLYVGVAAGDSAIDLVAAAPNLASAIGMRQLIAVENSQLLVRFVRPVRNALHDSVRLGSVLGASVAHETLAESLKLAEEPSLKFGMTALSKAVVIPLSTSQHYALQGQARSGKSIGLYSLLGQFRSYPGVQVTGIDPTGALPSAKDQISWVLPSESGLSPRDVSRWLDDIEGVLNSRLAALRRSRELDKFEWNDPQHPLLLVVFEEFPGVLRALKQSEAGVKPADRVTDRLRVVYGRLLMEALKINIRTLTVAQRADAEFLEGAERAQIACRITFKVDNQDAVRMFHDGVAGAEWEALREAAPGVGLIEQVGQPRTMFRAFNISFPEYRELAGALPEVDGLVDEAATK